MGCAAASRRRAAAVVVVAMLLAPTTGHAALIGSCTIVVLSSGQMAPNAAIAVLGSAQPGGSAAQVKVTANSLICTVLGLLDCFRVSAPAPPAFTTYPSVGGAGATLSPPYRLAGRPRLAVRAPTEVLNGSHTVAVDLSAARASGVFPAGAYQAQVTVRCE